MGAQTTFTPKPIPEAALEELARAQRAGELTGLLLADPSLSRFRTLYPFLLWADCPYCQQEPLLGLTEEVFLFNGYEGNRYVAYLGVSHSRPMSEPREKVRQIFEEKQVLPEVVKVEQVTYPVLYERARRHSEVWLTENIRSRRYIPQVYFPRKAMEGELETFLKGNKSGFLLLGESGIGKTNLLCRKVDEWLERGEIVLFYAGHQLNPDEPMEQRLLGDLHLQGDFIRLLEFVRKEGRRFIVVIDGVNEHQQSARLLQQLCEFTQRYGRNFPLKVILSVRSLFFTRMLQALGEGKSEEQLKSFEAGLFPSAIFQTHTVEREGRREETHRFELEAVDEEELREIYEGYRAFEGFWTEEGQLRRFRPTTPYESLTPQVRQVLRHPSLLRMVMEAYDGKPVPERLWTGEILSAYCEAKIFGRTDEERERFAPRTQLVTELVRLMRKFRRDNFLRDEIHHFAQQKLHGFSEEWSRALLERELSRSSYLQLLDEGVLMETPIAEEWGRFRRIVGYQVRFAFDPLFEFLLSNELLAEVGGWKGLTGSKVAGWLNEGREFDHLTGAVTLLLTEAVQQDNLNLVAETLNAADIRLAEPVILEVLTTLEGLRDEHLEPLLDELAERAESEKALRVLINASYQFGIKQRYRPALACTERAEELARHLVELEGWMELENELAGALVNKGVALSDLGRLDEAVDCYDEAIRIYQRLVEVEGRMELENELAGALMNKGNALWQMGRLSEAIVCCDEAIGIYRRLVEVEGRKELEDYLAAALMSKGNALWQLGRLSEAIDCHDEAIRIYRRLVEVEGRRELENYLAMALINKGDTLRQLGRLSEAIDCCDEAIGIYQHLIEVEGQMELENYLAMALMNKGNALWQMGRLSEAIVCCDEAIGIYRRLVEVEGRKELEDYLAAALMSKGNALCQMGRLDEAIVCYDEAIGIRRRLVEVEGRVELENELAGALVSKGVALSDLGRHGEAIDCFDEAIRIGRRLVEVEGRKELEDDLAMALMNKGLALWQFGRLDEAIVCCDEAIGIYRRLVEVEGRRELENYLAMALVNKGNALCQMGRLDEAIVCYDEAIGIRRRLVEVEGRVELENELAGALMNKGVALSDLGRHGEAIDCFDEAIRIGRHLVKVEGRKELEDDLAMALMNKGVALRRMGRHREALQCYDEGIGLWEEMMREGKVHVAPLLIRGLGIRFELKKQMSDWEEAAEDVRKVTAYLIPFLASGSLPEALAMEFVGFLQRLRQLTEEEWKALASALGEDAELVRQMLQSYHRSEGVGI